jgi:hypothetical protein
MKKNSLRALFLLIILLLNCNTFQTAGTVDDTDTGISISGKVLTKDGHGVPLVITRLAKTGFKDTTDANGVYNISVTKTQLAQAGISLDSIKTDTMLYIRDNEIFTYQTVSKWVAVLPDVYIVQRNISGKLNSALPGLKKIEAVISDNSDTLSNNVKVPLWYNSVNNSYSGFAYFPASTDIKSYSLYVTVYENDSGALSGRSEKIKFNSIAGDIEIPSFSPRNATPVDSIYYYKTIRGSSDGVNVFKDFFVIIDMYNPVCDSISSNLINTNPQIRFEGLVNSQYYRQSNFFDSLKSGINEMISSHHYFYLLHLGSVDGTFSDTILQKIGISHCKSADTIAVKLVPSMGEYPEYTCKMFIDGKGAEP